MLEFTKNCIVTGAEQRTKKDQTSYTILHILGDNGQTIACMYKGNMDKIFSLKKMQQYEIIFQLTVGQYTNCVVKDINDNN